MAAVWKYDDQSDLQWVPLAMYDGNKWKGNIDIEGYDSSEGVYNIHIYLVDGNRTFVQYCSDNKKYIKLVYRNNELIQYPLSS